MDGLAGEMELSAGGEGASVVGEIPPEVAAALQEHQKKQREDELGRINALGQSLARTRSEAIDARKQSGIEEVWLEDEEFFEGIDDANRGETRTLWRQKPPGQAIPKAEQATRSTVFPNITGPFVEAAAARIGDMLLPTDDRSWSIQTTPLPSALDAMKGKFDKKTLMEVAAKNPGNQQAAQQSLALAQQAAQQVVDEAKEKAEKAQTRIEDWLVECQWHANVRLVIEDAARIGTGILKGPIPTKKTRFVWKDNTMTVVEEIKPGSKWVDPWNFFPDGACGESVHNGAFTWERDNLTKKQLRDLKGQQDYIDENIDVCLAEGPRIATEQYKADTGSVFNEQDKTKYEIWFYHGVAERDDLEAAGCDCSDFKDAHVPAMIVMVNDRVIKAVLNPSDTGEFPYDVMVWRRRSGHWTGVGVSRQIRVAQRIITAAVRNLMDNAGVAAGPMLVFQQGVVTPADGKVAIAPRKIWLIGPDAENMQDATKAIGQIKVDMLVTELLQIVQLGLNMAERVTGLPMLLQGQMGKAPDTLGGMQMLNNNASSVLRRLAKLFDDRITEPHIRRYYYWLLQYGEDEEKGDYCIDARGSSALVERDLQNQQILQMGAIVANPIFGLDPKKWAVEMLKSQKFDPKRFEFDDEEWKKIVESMGKGQQDPRMAIAQFRAQQDERLTQMSQAFEAQEADKNRQLDLLELTLKERIASMSEKGKQDISLGEIQAMLAETVMKLRTQKELSAQDNQHDARKTVYAARPPTEPFGRAAPGQAFQH